MFFQLLLEFLFIPFILYIVLSILVFFSSILEKGAGKKDDKRKRGIEKAKKERAEAKKQLKKAEKRTYKAKGDKKTFLSLKKQRESERNFLKKSSKVQYLQLHHIAMKSLRFYIRVLNRAAQFLLAVLPVFSIALVISAIGLQSGITYVATMESNCVKVVSSDGTVVDTVPADKTDWDKVDVKKPSKEALNWAKNFEFTFIGDSLGVGVQPTLSGYFPKANFNVKSSRAWTHSDQSLSGYHSLESVVYDKSIKKNLVVALGTNQPSTEELLKGFWEKIPQGVEKTYFITTASEGGSSGYGKIDKDKNNDAIKQFVTNHSDKAVLVDWDEYVQEKMKWSDITSDSVHMTSEGYKAYAGFILYSLYGKNSNSTNSSETSDSSTTDSSTKEASGLLGYLSQEVYAENDTRLKPNSSKEKSMSLPDFKQSGRIKWTEYIYTYYGEDILAGGGLEIPGRARYKGLIIDGDGYIVLAAPSGWGDKKGKVYDTPLGYQGKVYDINAGGDAIDIYVQYTNVHESDLSQGGEGTGQYSNDNSDKPTENNSKEGGSDSNSTSNSNSNSSKEECVEVSSKPKETKVAVKKDEDPNNSSATDGTGTYPADASAGIYRPENLPNSLKQYIIDPTDYGMAWQGQSGWAEYTGQCVAFSETLGSLIWLGKAQVVTGNGNQQVEGFVALGLKKSTDPKKGAVFSVGQGYGHTGIVCHVFSDKSILIVEQNYEGYSGINVGEHATWNYRHIKAETYKGEGYTFAFGDKGNFK